MKYLLDTNVVSEWSKAFPDQQVMTWLARQEPSEVAVSVMTIAETLHGIETKPHGRRRAALEYWYTRDLMRFIEDRVVPLDYRVIQRWAELQGEDVRIGRTQAYVDSLIMTTAIVHGLIVVTRNVRHFRDRGVEIVNPWSVEG